MKPTPATLSVRPTQQGGQSRVDIRLEMDPCASLPDGLELGVVAPSEVVEAWAVAIEGSAGHGPSEIWAAGLSGDDNKVFVELLVNPVSDGVCHVLIVDVDKDMFIKACLVGDMVFRFAATLRAGCYSPQRMVIRHDSTTECLRD